MMHPQRFDRGSLGLPVAETQPSYARIQESLWKLGCLLHNKFFLFLTFLVDYVQF